MAVGDVEVDGLGRDAWHQWFGADGAIMLCPLPGTTSFQVQASHEPGPDGDALVLVRPDGYVGLIADADDASAVAGYLRSL